MATTTIASIKKEVLVGATQETAFKVFTEKIDLWWPKAYHVGKTPLTGFVLEPGINGRWYSTHEDGSEVNIGHVLTWDPFDLLVLNWQLGADYQFHPEQVTEVEVQFIPQGDLSTLVRFEHKNLHRMGEGGKAVNEMDAGWGFILSLYKDLVEGKTVEN
jgi:hypothetical protein